MNDSERGNFLSKLQFDNSFTRELPADPDPRNTTRQVFGACYSRVLPKPVPQPRTMAYSREVCELLGIDEVSAQMPQFAEVFGGNCLLSGMDPFAMCYGGHQFGNWAGQLGDGRAINLGEVINADQQRWMLQLKGAGPTPYSRTADGLAVLRSSVREFLCSEAMHHLGVPTTRALSLVTTGAQVQRDMFYDGNPQLEPGAIVCRVAPSFTRFGNFQIFAARQELNILRQLVEYTIRTDFQHLGEPTETCIANWYAEVCQRTLEMIVQWMRVGFVHGVMNTDNMSILGLTIDYGPYGWLEDYDPNWTPNTTDAQGRRYRFGQQSEVAHWNLWQLANVLVPLVEDTDPLQAALNQYADNYQMRWNAMMASKLGWMQFEGIQDRELIDELLAILSLCETDMTIFFRQLSKLEIPTKEIPSNGPASHEPQISADAEQFWLKHLQTAYYKPDRVTTEIHARTVRWLKSYAVRLGGDQLRTDARQNQMDRVNPKFVLRNYLAQKAIDKAETGDGSLIRELLEVLRRPYDEQPQFEEYAEKRPEWARHRAGCSMLSCSS